MRYAPVAHPFDKRFGGRPHVGAVMHFEGWTARRAQDLAARELASLGALVETADDPPDASELHAAATRVAEGAGGTALELWLVASAKPDAGAKLELRVFHALEDAALADEWLAAFTARLERARRS